MQADALLGPCRPTLDALPRGTVLVAVSGGSDSLALLNLLRAWGGRPVVAATVDHGLRPGSAEEAQQVAKICATWNVPHAILTWDTDPRGNLQAAARDARRALLRQEAERVCAATIALGHTVEDQAETFLLRLARGSGVDGLSAMAPLREERGIGITWARPLLSTRRADLQSYLTAQGLDWIRDPSNQDTSFDRVRLRQAAPALAELGLGAERLAATADMMGLARDALGQTAQTLAHEAAHPHPLGHLSLDIAPLTRAPLEVALRVLSASFNWVTGTQYRPRLSSLKPALRALGAQPKGALTLHGAQMRWRDGHGILCREPSKCAPPTALPGVWDGRFTCSGAGDDLRLGALGTDLLGDLAWRETGLSREVLSVSPALWRGSTLVAHPTLSPNPAHIFRHTCGIEAFFLGFISR